MRKLGVPWIPLLVQHLSFTVSTLFSLRREFAIVLLILLNLARTPGGGTCQAGGAPPRASANAEMDAPL